MAFRCHDADSKNSVLRPQLRLLSRTRVNSGWLSEKNSESSGKRDTGTA